MKCRIGARVAVALILCSVALAAEEAGVPDMPMSAPFEDTIRRRWLGKPVPASKLLDDMEDASTWSHHGFGEISLTGERSKSGRQSLRLTSPSIADKPDAVAGRPFGAATVVRRFDGEDWTDFNRLSFWVYPTLPGFHVISLCLVLHNDGREKVPNSNDRNGRNFVLLEPDRWNHIVWEIAHLGRDKVTGVEFTYRLQGNEPGTTTTVCYDFDLLELSRKQLQCVAGRNPFRQSTMYGEGYDYAPQYTAMSGDTVGSLPVGIQTHFERDEPDAGPSSDFSLSHAVSATGAIIITLTTATPGGDFSRSRDITGIFPTGR